MDSQELDALTYGNGLDSEGVCLNDQPCDVMAAPSSLPPAILFYA